MQLVEEPVDRHLVQVSFVDRVDVVIGDLGEHLLEQRRLLIDRPVGVGFALEQPPAASESHERDDGDEH